MTCKHQATMDAGPAFPHEEGTGLVNHLSHASGPNVQFSPMLTQQTGARANAESPAPVAGHR